MTYLSSGRRRRRAMGETMLAWLAFAAVAWFVLLCFVAFAWALLGSIDSQALGG